MLGLYEVKYLNVEQRETSREAGREKKPITHTQMLLSYACKLFYTASLTLLD